MIFDLVFLAAVAVLLAMLLAYAYLEDRFSEPPPDPRPYDQAIDGGCDWQSKPRLVK